MPRSYAFQLASLSLLPCLLALSGCSADATARTTDDVGQGALPLADPSVWRKQVIYLVMPDRFYNGDAGNDRAGNPSCYGTQGDRFHGGDLEGLRQKIPYLDELGVSTIWITPVYKQIDWLGEHCGYHGYWADFAFPDDGSIEPKLGDQAALHNLISDLHAQGKRLVLDMVVNHPGDTARIVAQKPSFFHDPATCGELGSRDVNCPLDDHPDFRQEDPTVAAYLSDMSGSWATRFAIDGIRMDTAKHVPTSYFQSSWIPEVRGARSDLFLLAEMFREGPAAELKPYLDAGFDSAFNFTLRRAFVNGFAKNGSLDQVASAVHDTVHTLGMDRALMMVNLLDNHDVPRFVNEPGLQVPEAIIRDRYHLALGALFTLPGIPQLYYGDELAMYGGSDPDNRRDIGAWAWTSAGRSQQQPGITLFPAQETFTRVQRLVRIRSENSALYDGYYAELWRPNGSSRNVYAFFRASGDSRIIAMFNGGGERAGDPPAGLVSMAARDNPRVRPADRDALMDGAVFDDLLGEGAPSPVTLTEGGAFRASMPAKTLGIYRQRTASAGAAVTFEVRAQTEFGQNIYLAGSAGELGGWNPDLAVKMSAESCVGTTCTWRVTLRYLAPNMNAEFKFLRKNGGAVMWEAGPNRRLSVSSAASYTVDGGQLR